MYTLRHAYAGSARFLYVLPSYLSVKHCIGNVNIISGLIAKRSFYMFGRYAIFLHDVIMEVREKMHF
jgi:hypothetical protein